MAETVSYFIHLGSINDTDPLPRIGSGFRFVRATIGRKWVRLVSQGEDSATRIPLKKWEEISKVEYTGQPFNDILVGLSRQTFHGKIAAAKEAS